MLAQTADDRCLQCTLRVTACRSLNLKGSLFIMSEEYKPGDEVPKSGIYKVTHDEHSKPHEVTCIIGKHFPPCNTCIHPRFVLVRAAHHIENHKHFDKS